MTLKQVEKQQEEQNRKFDAAKAILEILGKFEDDDQQEIIELVTEDE